MRVQSTWTVLVCGRAARPWRRWSALSQYGNQRAAKPRVGWRAALAQPYPVAGLQSSRARQSSDELCNSGPKSNEFSYEAPPKRVIANRHSVWSDLRPASHAGQICNLLYTIEFRRAAAGGRRRKWQKLPPRFAVAFPGNLPKSRADRWRKVMARVVPLKGSAREAAAGNPATGRSPRAGTE
jgi:hypothetical protein